MLGTSLLYTGLSCALLLLFGTFLLLILSVLVGLYTFHLSSLWPYLLVLLICLVAFISWMQMNALKLDHHAETEGCSSQMNRTIPTITGMLSATGSPITFTPPPPYCEASMYEVFKPSIVGEGCSVEAASMPPPSYDEAIKMEVPKNCSPRTDFHNQNTQSSRTCIAPPRDGVIVGCNSWS